MFKRRWVYHLITVFLQSILLLGVAYMTFYFKISNFQVKRISQSDNDFLYVLGPNNDRHHHNDGGCHHPVLDQ